ncbi:MAG: VWA domain-containing protein [Thermoanaerobaculia bacterium]|nr:VWA domain-containing protein [Thermoanaerobaculia bacterium]
MRPFTALLSLGILGTAGAGFGSGVPPGERPPGAGKRVVFILDASGSMKAKLGAGTRITAAKDVMMQLIRDLPSAVEFGVLAYGHRRKDDCADIEEIIPLGQPSKDAAILAVQKLSAAGKTPITASVRLAAQRLGPGGGPGAIILVSDGEETCADDPCGAVRDLKREGIAFTLHAVGFGVTQKEARQLECLAKEGGGTYTSAANAKELLDALEKVQRAEVATGELSLTARKQGKQLQAEVVIASAGGSRVEGGWTSARDPRVFHLLPGTYDVTVTDTSVSPKTARTAKGLIVKAGERTEKDFEFSLEGQLALSAFKNGQRIRAEFAVFKLPEKTRVDSGWLSTSGPVSVRLLAGPYEAAAVDTRVATRSERRAVFEVKSGETTTVDLAGFLEAEVELSAMRDGKRIRCEFSLRRREGGGRDSGWLPTEGPRKCFVLPGTYDLDVRCGDEKKKQEGITLVHGDRKTLEVQF